MIITCPSCQTRFEMQADFASLQGRQVQCGRCGHLWVYSSSLPPLQDPPLQKTATRTDHLQDHDESGFETPSPSDTKAGKAVSSPQSSPDLDTLPSQTDSAKTQDTTIQDGTERKPSAKENPASAPDSNQKEPFPQKDDLNSPPEEDPSIDKESSLEEDLSEIIAREETPDQTDQKKEENLVADSPVADSIEQIIQNPDPDPAPPEKPIPQVTLPEEKQRGFARSIALWILGLCLFGLMAGGIVSSILYRQTIMQIYPQSVTLYQLVGLASPPVGAGLLIENIRVESNLEEGEKTLMIHADLTNPSRDERQIPSLRGALEAADGQELRHWIFDLSPQTIMPGEIIPFTTTTINPPEETASLSITFFASPSPSDSRPEDSP